MNRFEIIISLSGFFLGGMLAMVLSQWKDALLRYANRFSNAN